MQSVARVFAIVASPAASAGSAAHAWRACEPVSQGMSAGEAIPAVLRQSAEIHGNARSRVIGRGIR